MNVPTGEDGDPQANEDFAAIAKQAVDYAMFECRDVIDTWRDIERKAQGTVAIAGIFIAGAVALLARVDQIPCPTAAVLSVVIALLTASVLFSIVALRVSTVETLPDSVDILELARRACTSPPSPIKTLPASPFWEDLIKGIGSATNAIHTANGKKAGRVAIAQVCLGIAVALVGALMIALVFVPTLLEAGQ